MCSWVLAKVPGDMGGGSATYSATAKGTGAEGAEGSATRVGVFFFFAKQAQLPKAPKAAAVPSARRQQTAATLQTMMMMRSSALFRFLESDDAEHVKSHARPSSSRAWSS